MHKRGRDLIQYVPIMQDIPKYSNTVPHSLDNSAPVRRGKPIRWTRICGGGLIALVYMLMLCPLFFVLWLSVFSDTIISFPPTSYTLSWYASAWNNASFSNGLLLSLEIAGIASISGVSLGVMAAVGIKRFRFKGSKTINTALLAPLLVPGIVAGIAIYLFYIRLENLLDRDIVGTYGGLILAHVCLTIPWAIRLVSAGMEGLDRNIEDAARNLGAGPIRTFFRITLPMLRPAIIASVLFSFIVSFENLEVSLPLVGPGRTTLPIAIMQYLEFNLDPTIAAVSAIQIILLGIFMLVTDRFVKLSQIV